MGLYEAEFLGQATPVKKTKISKPKPVKVAAIESPANALAVPPPPKASRKRKPKAASLEAEVDAVLTPPASDTFEPKPKKAKKAAVVKPPPTEPVKLKKTRKPKATKPVASSSMEPVEDAPKPKRKKKVVIENGTQTTDEPPLWFKTWHLDQAKRENSQKAKADRAPAPAIKEASQTVAAKQWSDGYTRDKIRLEQDNHQTRLYKMIHGRSGF